MKKQLSRKSESAFTLIELLVVIAIIGILAGLLFPAIQGALANAQALRVGNSGKNIVMAIIAANTEREAMSEASLWPVNGATFSGVAQNYIDSDAELYFAELIEPETADSFPSIEGLGWAAFAGGGVGAAKTRSEFMGDLNTIGNVWSYIGNLGDNYPGDTPFLFSRNLDLAAGNADLATYAPETSGGSTTLPQTLPTKLSDARPFGTSRVVFVTTGGAMQMIKQNFLRNPTQMFGSSILAAKGGSTTPPSVVRSKHAGTATGGGN